MNFTRAARSLNMSQPALTVRIRHLEDALGVRLLDRTTRSVTLTQVGREFLPIVERVLSEMDAVAVNARELAGRRRGLVTVAELSGNGSEQGLAQFLCGGGQFRFGFSDALLSLRGRLAAFISAARRQ